MKLVVGPTSAGKSTLITRLRDSGEVTGAIHLALELRDVQELPTGPLDVVHYNLLRARGSARRVPGPDDDPLLARLIDAADEVAVVSAPTSVLVGRAALRTRVEPHLREKSGEYPVEAWTEALQSPNLAQRYELLALHLDRCGKRVEYLCSNADEHDEFVPVSRWHFPLLASEHGVDLCRGGHAQPRLDFVDKTYQADYVDGSEKMARSASISRLLHMPLSGMRLLDVGCAEGAASLSAGRMGASVTGIEPWDKRFEQARAIGAALGSSVEFQHMPLENHQPEQPYDVVLALNVIHHQKDPFGFLRRLAELSTSHLVLEYPGLHDGKFLSTLETESKAPDDLPLLGLSTAAQDQTFVFSPPSIERYLTDTLRLFRKHDLQPSPIKNRWISVFYGKRRPGPQSRVRTAEEVRLRREVAALRKQINDLQNSRSWRVTAPLRRVRSGRR